MEPDAGGTDIAQIVCVTTEILLRLEERGARFKRLA